jgi:hypothetical protein
VCSRNLSSDDPDAQARIGAFLQGLQEFGWSVGRNVRIDYRWGGGDAERTRKHAAELVALAPDVILTSGGTAVAPLLQATRSVPIVFAQVPDPVGAGYVRSLARPGGNATGFTMFEYGLVSALRGRAGDRRWVPIAVSLVQGRALLLGRCRCGGCAGQDRSNRQHDR